MDVLVTGATGFIGSHTVRALQSAGHDVRILVRDPAKASSIFGTDQPAAVIRGDVLDAAAVSAALDGAHAVIHCAAVVSTRARRARDVVDTNVRSVELVVGGAVGRGVDRIVYLSSVTALFTRGRPVADDSPLGIARSAYARSKADGERLVRDLQDRGAPICTLYPPGVVGPDDPGLSEGNHAIRALLSQTMIDTSTGLEVVDVRDLATMIARLVDHGSPGRYVVAGRYLPWAELIHLFDELTGRHVHRVRVPGGVLRALGRVGDAVNRVVPFDFPLSREAMEYGTQWPGTVPSPALADIGPPLRPARETYADTIRWLYRESHLSAADAGRLADAQ